ncbi:hypothetical protein [Mesorhizobium sp. KR2-14]|uniref:hypothetical protein n=1 Tax=Mesorhizobium sp. KR2-14 TaxID=3156610 RepID=UPI0032B5CBBC
MQPSEIEQTLEVMLEAEKAAKKQRRLQRWVQLRKRTADALKGSMRSSSRRSDMVVAGLGITLGLVCAMFPWYIFFNPEKFGVEALRFDHEGRSSVSRPLALTSRFLLPSEQIAEEDGAEGKLDPFTTSTLADEQDKKAPVREQPFPTVDTPYRLLHVANGRGLIEDDTGLWVVQTGSLLPDSSRVAAIEQRGGTWVLLTDRERAITLTR